MVKMKEEKKATRQSYGEAIASLGEKNEDIVVLDADLSGATKTNIFAKNFMTQLRMYEIHPSNTNGICRIDRHIVNSPLIILPSPEGSTFSIYFLPLSSI